MTSLAVDRPGALVFISHDTRDGAIAEAFAELLQVATAGMVGSFRSEEIAGGARFYDEIIRNIALASDVVCLLTPRSYERPWVLYEAGYAMGMLRKRVHGLVLGMPMNRVTEGGPFGQFQNTKGDLASVSRLIRQLAAGIPRCSPAPHIVESEVKRFLAKTQALEPAAEETNASVPRLLHHVSLPVRKLEVSMEFYGTDMGLTVNEDRKKLRFGVPGVWYTISSEQQLHLIENTAGTYRATDAINHLDSHFAVRVPDLSAAYTRLSSKHPTTMNTEIAFRRYPHFYVLDPDWHVIEVNADNVSDQTVFGRD
jgi:catechol 2,3-dioxygenase-like lactoylglutathione lyase family enzyme